jgi:hypothetical protein
MGSIITKYQKCGKTNCKCNLDSSPESLHGPYYWSVKYLKPRNSLKKGKYVWTYIGKSSDKLDSFLGEKKEI